MARRDRAGDERWFGEIDGIDLTLRLLRHGEIEGIDLTLRLLREKRVGVGKLDRRIVDIGTPALRPS